MDKPLLLSLDTVLGRLKAASEITRLRLLALLSQGELTVSDLTSILSQSQPRISRHLKLLCDAGIIKRFPEGAWVYYRLVDTGPGAALISNLLASVDPSDAQLVRDRERLGELRQNHAARANEYFDQNAREWDAVRALHVPEVAVEQAMVSAIGDKNFKAHLDVGTGTGRIIELFAERCEKSIGIDANPRMLSLARNKISQELTSAQLRQANVYDLGPHNSVLGQDFDLVTIHQVLHFLDSPALAILEVARVTMSGGTIIITDFAPHSVEAMRTDFAHRRLGFSDEQLEGWLEAAGFSSMDVAELEPETVSGEELTVKIWTATKT